MRRKDRRVLVAELPGNTVPVPLDLGTGRLNRSIKPLELIFDGISRDEPLGDSEALVVHDERFAYRHPRRNRDTR